MNTKTTRTQERPNLHMRQGRKSPDLYWYLGPVKIGRVVDRGRGIEFVEHGKNGRRVVVSLAEFRLLLTKTEQACYNTDQSKTGEAGLLA